MRVKTTALAALLSFCVLAPAFSEDTGNTFITIDDLYEDEDYTSPSQNVTAVKPDDSVKTDTAVKSNDIIKTNAAVKTDENVKTSDAVKTEAATAASQKPSAPANTAEEKTQSTAEKIEPVVIPVQNIRAPEKQKTPETIQDEPEVTAADEKKSEQVKTSQDKTPSPSKTTTESTIKQLEDEPEPVAPGITIPLPGKKTLEIEGVNQELTQKYITQYTSEQGRKWLCAALEASVPYRPYIRQKLKEKDMPMLLQYLPIVESNYKVTAVSRSGATGIWQFMENSMAPLLKKNNWYDDRRDPWKSTDAALNKLAYNYTMFNDWAFAIGAYNLGAGAMKRITNHHPGQDFWSLASDGTIRSQTANYVPKLLAIAELVENAEYYGLIDIGQADKLTPDECEQYEFVNVAGMLSLNQISKVTEINRDTVKFLNPGLFRNCTPAREVYALRVPAGTSEKAEEALKKNGVPTDAITYKVTQGDSLWGISRKYSITVEDLCEVNGINEKGILSIGQTLIVPIFKE